MIQTFRNREDMYNFDFEGMPPVMHDALAKVTILRPFILERYSLFTAYLYASFVGQTELIRVKQKYNKCNHGVLISSGSHIATICISHIGKYAQFIVMLG